MFFRLKTFAVSSGNIFTDTLKKNCWKQRIFVVYLNSANILTVILPAS